MREIPEGGVLTLKGCPVKGNWASNLIPKANEKYGLRVSLILRYGLPILPVSYSDLVATREKQSRFASDFKRVPREEEMS